MIWINGRRVSDDAAHVSARDRGLTLSDGVFETMRLVKKPDAQHRLPAASRIL